MAARRESIRQLLEGTWEPRRALVVVDVQNDFADPAGSLCVLGGEETLPTINALVARASAAGAVVAYSKDWHPAETPHFLTAGGPWPVHCVAGTWGAELHRDLAVVGPVLAKGTGDDDGYSSFFARDLDSGATHPTGLDELLRERGATSVVVTGLALDVCVKATVLDARSLGYPAIVPLAATRAVNVTAGDDERAVAEMREAGAELL